MANDPRTHKPPSTAPDEAHPTEFIVEGRDRATQVWRRMFVTGNDKNQAMDKAVEMGVDVELVREARSEERPDTGINAKQREFGIGGVMAFALGIMGVLTLAVAGVMRTESPGFALAAAILGVLLMLYGVAGTTAFWVLSRMNHRD
ncbi:MAG: hypothetical protein ACTS27_07515 [Phycisphaerales bacterium]